MRYFLKNIAQDSMLRTVILIVLGVAMWVPSFLRQENSALVIVTLVLTIVNTLLTTHYFYRAGITSLPSPFVAATTWFGFSAIPALHTCWQAQFVIMGIFLALLVLLNMDYQHEATEEAFLATLICCIVAVVPSILFTGVMMLWSYLIAKRQMTWRVWAASLIAIAVRIVLMAMLHYMGWLEMIWMENIPHLSGLQWLLCDVVFLLGFLSAYLPLQRSSVGSGIFYLITIVVLAMANLLWHGCILYHYPIESIFL
jgi:hypothetical protein